MVDAEGVTQADMVNRRNEEGGAQDHTKPEVAVGLVPLEVFFANSDAVAVLSGIGATGMGAELHPHPHPKKEI